MADREEEDNLQMALRMSLHGSPPEPKRSKAIESLEESAEARDRRIQRELRAAAAERRMAMAGRSCTFASAAKVAPASAAARAVPVAVAAAPTITSSPKQEENKRIAIGESPTSVAKEEKGNLVGKQKSSPRDQPSSKKVVKEKKMEGTDAELSDELPLPVVNQLFLMLFRNNVSKGILTQWTC